MKAIDINKQTLSRHFNLAAHTYDEAALMQMHAADKLAAYLTDTPETILDIGSGTGLMTEKIHAAYNNATLFAIDLANDMLSVANTRFNPKKNIHNICGDADALPFPDHTFDLLVSNLMLQWSCELTRTLNEIYRVLAKKCAFVFTTLGPNTLHELKTCWDKIDRKPHVHCFYSQEQWQSHLKKAGFNNITIDKELFTLEFHSPTALMKNLKATGAHNSFTHRQKTLTPKTTLQQLITHYNTFKKNNARVPATFELLYVRCQK